VSGKVDSASTASSPVRKEAARTFESTALGTRPKSHVVKTISHPTLDGAVNKRNLSTGETGEFAFETSGFGLNPGVELARALILPSNQRGRLTGANLWNVADMDEQHAER